jgi:hypothetical protein
MRPVPIAPTLIRLLGAFAPNTDAGTIAGNPVRTDEAPSALPAEVRNCRREVLCGMRVLRSITYGTAGAAPVSEL